MADDRKDVQNQQSGSQSGQNQPKQGEQGHNQPGQQKKDPQNEQKDQGSQKTGTH